VEFIDELESNGFRLTPDKRKEVQGAIKDEIQRREAGAAVGDDDESLRELDTVADRGVGVGVRIAMHQLLPILAFASDRGIGVG
jgi:hypothetical protein